MFGKEGSGRTICTKLGSIWEEQSTINDADKSSIIHLSMEKNPPKKGVCLLSVINFVKKIEND